MSSSHSSSSVSESFESNFLITCGMCLKEYGEKREPKFLPCAHTFCQSCLMEIKQNTEIKCPICRKIHSFTEDLPKNNYVESLIELDIKLSDIEAREQDSVAQSVELKNDIQASLFGLSECAQNLETEMLQQLRKEFFTSTQIGQSPFGSKIDTFLSELRVLLNSPAPARNQWTAATETVCSWFRKHQMDNKDYANLLIELESRMIEMENREEWIFRHLKRDIKSSLAKLTKSILRAENDIMKQLDNNEILAMANVRKSQCDIHFQTVFKLESLWEKRLPIRGEPQNFQCKMQEYLAFVIRHLLSDEIVFIWIEQQHVYKVSLELLSNRELFTAALQESKEGPQVPVDLSNTPYRDLHELYSALIFALATAAINNSIKDKSGDCKLDHAILKRWASSILKRYIDESDSSGMQLIFVVQTLVAKLQHPKGLMQEIFEVLCEEGLLSWVIDPSIVAPSTGESSFQGGSKLVAYLISDLISSYMADKSLHEDKLDESVDIECIDIECISIL